MIWVQKNCLVPPVADFQFLYFFHIFGLSSHCAPVEQPCPRGFWLPWNQNVGTITAQNNIWQLIPYLYIIIQSDPKRTPSWCDRILHKGDIQQESFKCFLDVKNSDHRPVVGIYKCFLKDLQNVETSLNTVYKVTPQKIQFQKQRLFQACRKTVVFTNDSPTSIFIDQIISTDKCIWASFSFNCVRPSDKTEIDIGCCLDIDDFKECKDSNIKTVNLLFKYNDESNFIQMRCWKSSPYPCHIPSKK